MIIISDVEDAEDGVAFDVTGNAEQVMVLFNIFSHVAPNTIWADKPLEYTSGGEPCISGTVIVTR